MTFTEAAQKYEEEKQKIELWTRYLFDKLDRMVYNFHTLAYNNQSTCDTIIVERKEPTAIMMNERDARYLLEFERYQCINTNTYDGFWRFKGIPIYRCLDMVEGEIKVL